MAAGIGNEKQSLGKFVKSQAKYGTTTTAMSKNRCTNYVKHTLTSGDSLAHLALKYSVTVEQIKRENKLWSNDSLFLKDHVYIPVTRENSACLPENSVIVGSEVVRSSQGSATSQKHNGNGDSVHPDALTDKQIESFSNTAVDSNSTHSGRDVTKQPAKGSALDFLSKYDSSIAQLKTNVKKMEQNAAFLEKEFPLTASYTPRRHTVGNVTPGSSAASLYKRHSYEVDPDSSPILVIRSRTKDVQSSLERLEKTSDEFFQL